MPKCLFRYQWVKLPRTHLPVGKGNHGLLGKAGLAGGISQGSGKILRIHKRCNARDVVRWRGRLKEHSGRQKPHRGSGNHGYAQPVRVYPLQLDEKNKEAGIFRHRLGCKMLRRRMHEWSSLRNRRLWLSLPSPQYHAAPCGSALYIRRIRCMAGPLVPHGLAGDRQCVFLSGACRSIRGDLAPL